MPTDPPSWPLAKQLTEESQIDADTGSLETSSGELLVFPGEVDEAQKVRTKINQIRERIRQENISREVDVDEYIRLTQQMPITPDNPQLMRVRQVFEKKNKTHNKILENLSKKLESWNHRLAELEGTACPSSSRRKGVGQGLKDMSANLRDYTGSMISVPKDLASKLKGKFGSADNLQAVAARSEVVGPQSVLSRLGARSAGPASNMEFFPDLMDDNETRESNQSKIDFGPFPKSTEMEKTQDDMQVVNRHRIQSDSISNPRKYATLRERVLDRLTIHRALSADHANLGQGMEPSIATALQHQSGVLVSPVSPFSSSAVNWDPVLLDLSTIQKRQIYFEESIHQLRLDIQQEYASFHKSLHDEKFRYQRLEDQMNDTVELHQAEVQNLKQEIQSLTAKLEYQHDERFRDIQDMVENTQTRISKVEAMRGEDVQEGADGLQLLSLQGMNILIMIIHFLLILINVVVQLTAPFFRTRRHMAGALVGLLSLVLLWQWSTPLGDAIFRRFPLAKTFWKKPVSNSSF